MIENLTPAGKIFWNILQSATPAEDLERLEEMGLLQDILPELVALKGVDRVGTQAHKDNFYHTIKVVRNTRGVTVDPWLICLAILHDVGKARTKRYDKELGWTFHLHRKITLSAKISRSPWTCERVSDSQCLGCSLASIYVGYRRRFGCFIAVLSM